MYENPYDTSLETRVLSATPTELIQLLYEGAIEAVQAARQHLSQGRIAERGRSVSKAVEILSELSRSLNHTAGGDLSSRLAALYDYMQRTLLEANFSQTDGGLAETEGLLKTMAEAWRELAGTASSGGSGVSAPPADNFAWMSYASESEPVARQWSA